MQLSESSIYIGLKRLRSKLYQAQFLMDKANRIIYGTPLMEASAKTVACFILAFEVKEKRIAYLEESIGWFAVLRNDLDFCVSQNIIHYAKKKPKLGKDGKPIPMSPEAYTSTQKIELFKLVAQIDSDICKWRASLAKGKTISDL